jgi:hypothetical protein
VLAIIIFINFSANAKKIKIKDVTGTCIISEHITLAQAREKAILEAKKEALRKAGIGEQISSADILETTTDEADFEQAFNSISTVELNGEVIDYEVTNEITEKDQFNNLYIQVTLNATVMEYKNQRDISFNFSLENVQEFYNEGDNLIFRVQPSKEGYMKIFLFEGKELASQIFPNAYEPDSLFAPGQWVSFPTNPIIEYEMATEKEKEVNHLVLVYTKKSIPYTEKVNYKNIIRWIYSIPPDQRAVKYSNFFIVGKD